MKCKGLHAALGQLKRGSSPTFSTIRWLLTAESPSNLRQDGDLVGGIALARPE